MATSTIEFGTTLQQLDTVIKERESKNLDENVTQFMRIMQKEISIITNTPHKNLTPELLNALIASISAATEACNDNLARLNQIIKLQKQREGILACLTVLQTCKETTDKRIADGDFDKEVETAEDDGIMVEAEYETDSALWEFEGQ